MPCPLNLPTNWQALHGTGKARRWRGAISREETGKSREPARFVHFPMASSSGFAAG